MRNHCRFAQRRFGVLATRGFGLVLVSTSRGAGSWIARPTKRGLAMDIRYLVSALAIYALAGSVETRAQESLVSYKSLAPETALDLARAALADCQKRGYQVAVAIVDRFGVVQVVLRDRYTGPHTPATASGKAWTAATFRNSTSSLFAVSQPGLMQAGIRNLPCLVFFTRPLSFSSHR